MSIILYIIVGVVGIIIILAVIGWFIEVYEAISIAFTRKGANKRRTVGKTEDPTYSKSAKKSIDYNIPNPTPKSKTDIASTNKPEPIVKSIHQESPTQFVPVTSFDQKDPVTGKESPVRFTAGTSHKSDDRQSSPKPVKFVPRNEPQNRDVQQDNNKPTKYKPKQ